MRARRVNPPEQDLDDLAILEPPWLRRGIEPVDPKTRARWRNDARGAVPLNQLGAFDRQERVASVSLADDEARVLRDECGKEDDRRRSFAPGEECLDASAPVHGPALTRGMLLVWVDGASTSPSSRGLALGADAVDVPGGRLLAVGIGGHVLIGAISEVVVVTEIAVVVVVVALGVVVVVAADVGVVVVVIVTRVQMRRRGGLRFRGRRGGAPRDQPDRQYGDAQEKRVLHDGLSEQLRCRRRRVAICPVAVVVAPNGRRSWSLGIES
jgi:hypothetical protein